MPAHQATAKAICKAVEQGDVVQLRSLLTALQGLPDCDCGDVKAAEKIATMLALPAAQRGHAAIIYLLHEFGGTFEEVDEDRGGPPLMHAANNGHAAAVTALLKVGGTYSPLYTAEVPRQASGLVVSRFARWESCSAKMSQDLPGLRFSQQVMVHKVCKISFCRLKYGGWQLVQELSHNN